MILLSFAMNFIAVALFRLAIIIPESESYTNQDAFKIVLESTARITCASFVAYLTGSLVNSKIMVILRDKCGETLFMRAITSTIAGQICDNAIFAFGAFFCVLPTPTIISMIAGGTLLETFCEMLFYPITKRLIKKLKNKCNVERYSENGVLFNNILQFYWDAWQDMDLH